MKVADLIKALQALPPEAAVFAWSPEGDRSPIDMIDHWDDKYVDLHVLSERIEP